jgi:hypothetical protein
MVSGQFFLCLRHLHSFEKRRRNGRLPVERHRADNSGRSCVTAPMVEWRQSSVSVVQSDSAGDWPPDRLPHCGHAIGLSYCTNVAFSDRSRPSFGSAVEICS